MITPLLQFWLDQFTPFLARVPETVVLATLVVPVAVAIFSKRLFFVLGSLILGLVALLAFATPSNAATTLAVGCYFGSWIVALSGISARRKARALRADLATLRRDVGHLLAAEERRVLTEVRTLRENSNPTISGKPEVPLRARGERE